MEEQEKIIKIWPKWRVEKVLGRGSFGTVYKACRKEPGYCSYAAIKVIRVPQNASELRERRQEGMDEESLNAYYRREAEDLRNEIRVMESLKTAGNIVSIEDCQLEKQERGPGWELYIRMELLESLPAYIERKKELQVEEIVKLGIDICEALKACEMKGVVHRDIKPDNIFVNEYGTFKLGDFGIAKKLESTRDMLSQKGTGMYMAPELWLREKGETIAGKAVDIYALGITLYKLLNKGRFPFMPPYPQAITPEDREKAEMHRLNKEVIPLPLEGGAELGSIVVKACAPDSMFRYQNAQEFQNELLNWRSCHKGQKNQTGFDRENFLKEEDETAGEVREEYQEEKTAGDFQDSENFGKKDQEIQTEEYGGIEEREEELEKTQGLNNSEKESALKKEKRGHKGIKIALGTGICAVALICVLVYYFTGNRGVSENSVTQNLTRESETRETETQNTEENQSETKTQNTEENQPEKETQNTEENQEEVSNFQILGSPEIILPGDQVQLRTRAGSMLMTSNPDITWASSDEEIASVDNMGIFTAHKAGTVEITGEYQGQAASFQTQVVETDIEYGATIWPDADSISMATSGFASADTEVNFTLGGNIPEKFLATVYFSPEIALGLNSEWKGYEAPVLTMGLSASSFTGEGIATIIITPEEEPYHVVASTQITIKIS